MTDVAALGVRVDSDGVLTADKALDAFAKSADRASASADKVEGAGKRAASGARELGSGAKAAQSAVEALEMAERATASRSLEMATNVQKAGNSLKFTRLEGLNFSRQFADIGVTAASGMNPLLIAIQQGPQLLDILQNKAVMAGTTVGTVMKAAGAQVYAAMAPLAPIIAIVTAAAGALALGVGMVTAEINKTSTVTVTWQDVMLGAFDVVKGAIAERVTAAFKAMGLDVGSVWDDVVRYTRKAVNLIIGASLAVPQLIRATYDKLPAAFGDAFYAAANLAIRALNELARMSAAPMNSIIDGFNGAFGTSIPRVVMGGIAEIANPYAGAMAALGKAGAASLVKTFETDYVGAAASVLSEASQKRARLRKAAEKGGSDLGAAAGRSAAQAMGKALEAEGVESLVDALSKASMDEFYKNFLDGQAKEWEDFNSRVARTVDDQVEGQLTRGRLAAEALNEELERAISLLEGMGSAGDVLAGLFAIVNGSTESLSGPFGAVLNTNVYRTGDDGRKIASTIGKEISEVFKGDGPFAKTMTSVLQGVGTGASVGAALFSNSKASQFGAVAGGALGEVAGEKLLSGMLGKMGDFAGPLGSILGSVAGGLLGGILNPNRSASANITGVNSISVNGKDRANYDAAGDLGASVTSGLKQIADAFGAQLGAFQVAIGTRGDEIRVNTGGTSLKTGAGAKGFGEDAEAAARYAILDAINDGALKGMREGSLRLLKAGDDLDAALQKATSFENVFAELRNATDPTGAALDQLDKQFAELRTIFEEAGASAAEYADLEKLLSIRREEVLSKERDALDDIRSRIAEVQGDDETVRAIERQRELKEAMSDTVRAELERLYAIEDSTRVQQEAAAAQAQATAEAQAAAQAAAEIQKARTSLQIELLEAQGQAEQALALTRQQQLADLDPLLRGLQEQVWAAQDAAKAQAELADAQKAAADAAQASADRMNALQVRLYNAQGNSAAAQQLQNQLELAGAQTDAEKAMLENIYAAEAAAAKAAAAAEARAAAQQAAEEARQKAEQIAAARNGLQLELLRALGKGEQALALERKIALEAMDKSLRPLQQQVWAAQEASATADKFRDFGKTLREFREGLIAGDKATADAYRTAQVAFMTTSALAKAGDEAAIGKLTGVSQSYLDVSRDRAGSLEQYQRDLAAVLRSVDDTLDYTDGQVDVAERTLDQIGIQTGIQRETRDEIAAMRAENKAAQIAMTTALNQIRRLNEGEDGDGVLRVKVEA